MPRKSTKSGQEAPKSAKTGVDKRPMPSVSQIIENMMIQGKPEPDPAKGKKTGRPSSYSKEAAEKMCELLSDGIPLREICRMEGMPAWRTVYDWMYRDDALGEKGVGLSAAIARAREVGYDAIAEECLIIADTPKFGQKQVMSDEGSTTTVEDMLGHRKLQIETRLKLLAKWNPKKYGDRQILAGDPENPLEVQTNAMDVLAAAVKNLELKRQTANDE